MGHLDLRIPKSSRRRKIAPHRCCGCGKPSARKVHGSKRCHRRARRKGLIK